MRHFRHFPEVPHLHIIPRRIKGDGGQLPALGHGHPVHGQDSGPGCRTDGAGIAHHPQNHRRPAETSQGGEPPPPEEKNTHTLNLLSGMVSAYAQAGKELRWSQDNPGLFRPYG